MKSLLNQHKLLAFFAALVLVAGCKQPETIVIDENPTAVASTDTTEKDQVSAKTVGFRKLVIGEYNEVQTLDPLFVEKASEMRAIQLVYEGLTRFDSDGAIMPGLSKNWKVSNDSLTYTFTLRENIYYQDSDVFSTGTGRKMTSADVKFAFERMAQAEVPPMAAHLFMEIEGFEPYFQEQHEVYLPDNRKIESISGIRTPTDTTVVFELVNQDPNFLKKLATPLAVIYPKEAIGQTVNSFAPVGTGPFQFSSRTADTSLVFSKFQNYYAASKIELNRVDIISSGSESKLFQAMSKNEIYVLPQLGPQTLPVVLRDDGVLQESYAQRYDLSRNRGYVEYVMRRNPSADISKENGQSFAAAAKSMTNNYFNKFPDAIVVPPAIDTTVDTDLSNIRDQIYTTFSDDPFVKTYLGTLSKALSKNGITLQMQEIRVPSRNTALFFTQNYPLIPDRKWEDYPPLFSFKVYQASLQRKEIIGLDFNQYPWWVNLRGVTLPAPENLN
jgi:ABC-type transport system substrate-binding protein